MALAEKDQVFCQGFDHVYFSFKTCQTGPMLFCNKISMFYSFNIGGDGRTGAKKIMTNANTNENTGAKVTINSRAPEVPSDGVGDGRSYT